MTSEMTSEMASEMASRRVVLGLLLALGATALTVGARALHAQQPSRTGSARAGIDVMHYEFRVDFPAAPFPETIAFVATTTARRTTAVASLSLDLAASLRVDSAQVNEKSAAFARAGDSVRVALPEGQSDTVRVRVFYRGLPSDGLIVQRDSTLGWMAFGDNFPDRARQWLATVDHPSDKALVDWIVRAPATHRVIANGLLVEETPEPGPAASRMVRTHWRTVRPIYTAVMVIGVAPFAVQEIGATACGLGELPGCVPQSVWMRPSQRALTRGGELPGGFARAGEIVSLFSRLAGPFPYEKLAHVSSSTRYGGMENAGAIFYADQIFDRGAPDEKLIAHETAHQWFGDAVTEHEWPHVWLSESFATYFAALWTEHAHGDTAFRADLTAMRAKVLKAPIAVEKPVIDEGLDDLRRVLGINVYEKGGFVLHMLRREVGDSAFFRGIQRYYAAHRHGNAMTADLQRAIEAEAGQSLDWFFDQWLRRPGFAELTVRWQWNAATQRLQVVVDQGARFAPYRLALTADVTTANGKVERVRIAVPATRSATITVPLALTQAPSTVVFDADVSVLGTVSAAAAGR